MTHEQTLKEVEYLKECLDRFAGLLPQGRTSSFYAAWQRCLLRWQREVGHAVEYFDSKADSDCLPLSHKV
ncbi:hypothetical protein LCGC14_0235660 [marine sediment metagenome]|uniref:Uncharacterized protein n=1 Tax=marine sediment metagenome TaxID=412755 RepID=A0A0F9U909_9ZZZZ